MESTIIILFTAALGSFCNNVISAYINYTSLDIGRSRCFCGKKKLGLPELIPVLSFVIQRGRCTKCSEPIPVRYLLVELLSISFGVLYFLRFGLSPEFILGFLGFQTLLAIAVIDYYKYIIPNKLVLFLLILCLIKYSLQGELPYVNILGALAVPALLIAVNQIHLKIKGREVIGAGDIKLISVLVLFFGIPGSLLGLWISAAAAIPGFYLLKLFVKRFHNTVQIPFGFFLAVGYVLTDMVYESIINSYLTYLAA
jgi:prepilin signal peptidase PulO-like enzyme (type II secretory pathway)